MCVSAPINYDGSLAKVITNDRVLRLFAQFTFYLSTPVSSSWTAFSVHTRLRSPDYHHDCFATRTFTKDNKTQHVLISRNSYNKEFTSLVELKFKESAYEKLPVIDLSKIRTSTCQRRKNSEFTENKERKKAVMFFWRCCLNLQQ